MFSPWIKRKSLKRWVRGRSLVADGVPPNTIALLSVAALVVVVGAVAVTHTRAAAPPASGPLPTPAGTLQSPTPSPTMTPASPDTNYSP